jgi:zinc protease
MFLALVLLAMIPSIAAAAETQAPQVQEVILENGLKVLLLENHKSPIVTFQVWYRVGSRNELDGKSGLAHFLEHMMFKGTRKVPPEEYSRIIARNGGRSNAFTTTDMTVYFATMSRDKIGIEIEMEADRMVNALLDGNSFEAEKKVVMEERRLRTEDNPTSALAEVTSAAAYLIHPYRRPVIGWMSDIEGLTRDDLRKYYRTYYSPNNAFLVVVGDFSTPDMLTRIRAAFGKIPRGPETPKVTLEERPQSGERRVTLKKEAELPFLLMYYHAPNLRDSDSYALDVLTTILSAGRSSRLHQDLVYRKRIATSVSADYEGLSIDPTVISVSAQVMPDKDVAEVRRAIHAHLERVRTEPVTDKELEKARNQAEAAFVFGQDSVFGQAMRIGRFEITGDWKLLNSYLAGIRKVTAADVLRVAKKYLDPDRRTIGVLIPTKEKAL